jgi:hypothetical protein
VDFKKLADQAKSAVDKRGGTESLKEDLGELKDIAKSKGSLADKAKEAAAAIKDPGDAGDSPPAAPSPEPNAAKEPIPDPAAAGPEHHGKRHGQDRPPRDQR